MSAEPRIDQHFQYQHVLSDVITSPSRTFVDVGCCMGTDLRTLISHGYPARNIMGLDRERRLSNWDWLFTESLRKTLPLVSVKLMS